MKPALSNLIRHVFDPGRDPITCGELVDELDRHGMAVILILFSIPAALPVPAAGYSTLLSIPLLIIGLRLLAGYDNLWLPARLRQRPFSTAGFNRRVVDAMLRLVQVVERFSSPRLTGLVRAPVTRVITGLIICALACSMLLPIPGTNTAPAFGIFLIGFSLLEDDGVLLLAGILCSLLALFISLLLIFFGYKSYVWLREAVQNWF